VLQYRENNTYMLFCLLNNQKASSEESRRQEKQQQQWEERGLCSVSQEFQTTHKYGASGHHCVELAFWPLFEKMTLH